KLRIAAETHCMLSAAGPDVVNEYSSCLDAVMPFWAREVVYIGYDSIVDGNAWAREFFETGLTVALPIDWETVRHKFASHYVLPEALLHFDHGKWPDCANVINDKIVLHKRALAGDMPTDDEWDECISGSHEAAWLARAAWAKQAAAAAGDRSAAAAALAAQAALVTDESGAAWAAWAAGRAWKVEATSIGVAAAC
ncbi:MAG: hypothetical protein U5K75_10915, partial [Ahrensia sp.]|nr:hypothetical protein [Ahrensia sp.]